MNDLPSVLGDCWADLITLASPPQGDFEYQFAWIHSNGGFESDLRIIENRIEEHFSKLQLPDEATIYDHLILGLRGKDLIATFNWDPCLLQAHRRNRDVAELPDIRFLHGCVHFATCMEHDVMGVIGEECPRCHNALVRGGLLFPHHDKDYTSDQLIARDWSVATNALASASHLTIFGYSGPTTDYRARKLILDNWNESPSHEINHLEIIDTADYDHIIENWKGYFPHHHRLIQRDFWDSSVARWPRRTIEWKLLTSLYGIPCEYIDPPRSDDLALIQEWYSNLAHPEEANNKYPKVQQTAGRQRLNRSESKAP